MSEAPLGEELSPKPHRSLRKRVSNKVKCSNCGSENAVEIYYGYPPSLCRMTPMIFEKNGPEWGGHCVQEPWDPTYRCSDCGKAFRPVSEVPRSPAEWKAYHDNYPTINLVLHLFEHGHPVLGCRSVPRSKNSVHYSSYHFRKVLSSFLLHIKTRIRSTVEVLVEAPARIPQRFTTHYPYPDLKHHRKLCVECVCFLPLTVNECPYCGTKQTQADTETTEKTVIKIKQQTDPDVIDQKVYDYIVAHNGRISPSKTIKDLALHENIERSYPEMAISRSLSRLMRYGSLYALKMSIERLKSLGLLSQKSWSLPF